MINCPKPLKINMEHNSLEVWFRSFSFLFMGDGCRFQPLIFQGVIPTPMSPQEAASPAFGSILAEDIEVPLKNPGGFGEVFGS